MHGFDDRNTETLCSGWKKKAGAMFKENGFLFLIDISQGNKSRSRLADLIIELLNVGLPDLATEIQVLCTAGFPVKLISL